MAVNRNQFNVVLRNLLKVTKWIFYGNYMSFWLVILTNLRLVDERTRMIGRPLKTCLNTVGTEE